MRYRDNEAGEYGMFYAEWTDASPDVSAHTSGSTGMPKKIMLPKHDMRLSARATNRFFGIGENSLLVIPLSARYIAGKMMMVRALEANCRLLCESPSNHPLAGMDEWAGDDIDLVAIVPSQLDGLIESPYFGNVRNVIVGGAPMSAKQEEKAVESGVPFYATYGMTETCSHVALRRCGDEWYKGLPGVVFSVDGRGCLVIERNGVTDTTPLVTNDIVELRGDGAFRWIGRADNVIISGGLKVSPEEVERKICGLIGSPYFIGGECDDKWGEHTVLYIEGKEMPDELSLLGSLKKVLKSHEMPRRIVMTDCIPRTENGKIKRGGL